MRKKKKGALLKVTWDFEQFDGYSNKIGSTGEKLENTGATIIKIIEVLSLGIAIFMLVIYGIMYIFTSTTEKKVEMKKNMPNYIAGVILTFSAAVLLEIVSSFINENINK